MHVSVYISEQYENEKNGIITSSGVIKGVIKRLKELALYEYAIKEGYLRFLGMHEPEEQTLFSEKENADSSAEQPSHEGPPKGGVEGVLGSGSECLNNNIKMLFDMWG